MGSIRRSCHFPSMTTNQRSTSLQSDISSKKSAFCDILCIKRCTINNSLPAILSKRSANCCHRLSKDSTTWRKKSAMKSCGSIEEADEKRSEENNNSLAASSPPININIPTNKSAYRLLSLESITEESLDPAQTTTHSRTLSGRSSSSSVSSMSSSTEYSFALSENGSLPSPSPTFSDDNPMDFVEEHCHTYSLQVPTSCHHTLSSNNDNSSTFFTSPTHTDSSLLTSQWLNNKQSSENSTTSPRANSVVKSGCLVLLSHSDNPTQQSVFKHRSVSPYETVSSSKLLANNSYNENISRMSSSPNSNCVSRCPVMVKIHQKSKYEKYAVVANTKRHLTTSPFYLRLKNARVTYNPETPCHVTVSLNGADAKSYKFEASSPQIAKEWAEAFSNESPLSAFANPNARRKLFKCSNHNSDQLLVISEKNEFRLNTPTNSFGPDLHGSEGSFSNKSSVSSSPSLQNIPLSDKSMYIVPRSPTMPVLSEALEEAEDDISP